MDYLKKILNGFLLGIGFGISAGLITYFIYCEMMENVWQDELYEHVKIQEHRKEKHKDDTVFLGTLKNEALEIVRLGRLEIDFFDENGRFVNQCTEYIPGSLQAGASRNFKVCCYDTKDEKLYNHKSYKINIVGM